MGFKKTIVLLGAVLCLVPSAFAYLDPGSGSYILQAIVAGALGGAYAIKLYWIRIVGFFKGKKAQVEEDTDEI